MLHSLSMLTNVGKICLCVVCLKGKKIKLGLYMRWLKYQILVSVCKILYWSLVMVYTHAWQAKGHMFNSSMAQISFRVVLNQTCGANRCSFPVTIEQLKVTFTVKVNLISLGHFFKYRSVNLLVCVSFCSKTENVQRIFCNYFPY